MYLRSYSVSMCSGRLRDSAGTQWSSRAMEQSRHPDAHRVAATKRTNPLAAERTMYCYCRVYVDICIYTSYIQLYVPGIRYRICRPQYKYLVNVYQVYKYFD